MSRHSNKKSFIVGTLLGGIIGGVTALLFAPKSGNKLRKDIARKYNDASEKTKELMDDVSDQAKELVEKAKIIAEDAKDAAQAFFKDRK